MVQTSFLLTIFLCATFSAAAADPGNRPFTQVLVQHRKGADTDKVASAFAANHVAIDKRISQIDVSVLRVPTQAAESVRDALEKTGLFNYAELDGMARTAVQPNDPSFPSQWHLATIQAPDAWNITRGSSSVTIAVIDSGADPTHPDLATKLVPGWSFLTGTSNTADTFGHGTAVTGTAAAATDNSTGVAGVGWQTTVMPLVVTDASGFSAYSSIANAIVYAADHGVRLINISLAGGTSSSTLQSAVDHAWTKGAVIFAAAGNNGTSNLVYPAACNHVVAVSATNSDDTLANFSSFGSWIDLSAPGNYITTLVNGGGYGAWEGTSFASPIAAGVAALVLSLQPAMANTTLVSLLEQNSDDLGPAGHDSSFGWGRVNAYKAVSAAASTAGDAVPPTVVIASPISTATVAGSIQVQGTATDNVGVTKIEFYLDNILVSSTPASPFSFSWNTTSSANATHTLVVKAYDLANNVGQASVTINVNNNSAADSQPPTVMVMSPVSGSVVSGQTKINVSASDNVGVTQVSVYIDSKLLGTGSVAPYTFLWNTRKAGTGAHTITAKAWDAAGNSSLSGAVSVIK